MKKAAQRQTRKTSKKGVASSRPSLAGADSFPIVGIGASAGGLEALEQFLGHVPPASGLAFVIVQHLDPTREGVMPQLLQRATPMKVVQVKDRIRVRPDCVYVIPPNKDMSILHGVLHLLPPSAPRGLGLPIDFFMRALAQDRRESGIGVILSGMGSDGAAGLQAIKENGGLVLVQEPSTAKFDGMPRSAIESGAADIVAPASQLPARILACLRSAPRILQPEAEWEDKRQGGLDKALILLRARTGRDFSRYKRSTLYRRIERRMGIHEIQKISDYVRFLQKEPQELDCLFKELLIGVTSFFRDPKAWEQLRDRALPELLANRSPGRALRAWVPGCSTGEEAYSLAIVFKEALKQGRFDGDCALQVFATDLNGEAIEKGRRGVYQENIAADVSPERLARFFVERETGFGVRDEIREMVILAPQDLIVDPPFTKLDILICRNVLIYLSPEVQKKLIPLFHFCMNPGGILLLGSAETVGGFTNLFGSLDSNSRLYRRLESSALVPLVDFPSSFHAPTLAGSAASRSPENLQTLADRLILERHAPPAVLVSAAGDILYVSGRTAKYLEPAAGKANWNVFAMARGGLRNALSAGFQKALRQERPVVLRGLRPSVDDTGLSVDVTIQRVNETGPLEGSVMIVFTDVPSVVERKREKPATRGRARGSNDAALERELEEAREEARSTREEMQISQEELRAANEELQSTNEELQSTNEELTTSKEEMQSMNEELQTLNVELLAKVDELSQAGNDMKNILNSTDIAIIFLDSDLHVRRFTTRATRIVKLIPTDVGRPITDLASNLRYPDLAVDAREVLRTLVLSEKTISADDGRWYSARIMPYRVGETRIDGVVITFADITDSKRLEAELRRRQAGLERRIADQANDRTEPGEHEPSPSAT